MKCVILLQVSVAALLAGALAHAEEPTASSPVVPTLQVSGSTSGKGQISIGVDFRARRDTWDVFLNPSFSVANSSGITSVIGMTSADGAKGPTQFSGSLSATFAHVDTRSLDVDAPLRAEQVKATALCMTHRGSPDPSRDRQNFETAFINVAAMSLMNTPEPKRGPAYRELVKLLGAKIAREHPGCTFAERDAASGHAARCSCNTSETTCNDDELIRLAGTVVAGAAKTCPDADIRSPICEFLEQPERANLPVDPANYCDAGRDYLNASEVQKAKKRGLRRLLYPEHLMSLGVTYGAASFKFVDNIDGALRTSTLTRSSVSGNALYTFVQAATGARFTFELPVGFRWTWKESSKIAHQCAPPIGTIGGESVQECKQLPLNAPTEGIQLSGAAYFGLASVEDSDLWRAAIGPTFMYDFASNASTTYQVGGQIPFYFSLTTAAGVETEYQGLVRIMPTVLAERSEGKVGATASLSIALLGKRKMFGSGLFSP
jgi:hypothetical protein